MKFWKVMALMLVALLALSPMRALAEAASDDGAQVTVSGTGVVNLRPDTATITLGVSETAKGAVAAQTTVNKKIAAVKKALIKAGAKEADISVSDLSVWGVYDYSGETQKLTGYSASHTLNITTADMEQVGPLVDAALDAGANQLQGVSFSVKDDGEAYNQALKLAVEKAREKAEVLAAATGVALGSLVSLNESDNFGYAPYANAKYAVADEGMGAAPTQVDTGMVTISATVTAVYGLES
jgi:uncharacterized protein YggE